MKMFKKNVLALMTFCLVSIFFSQVVNASAHINYSSSIGSLPVKTWKQLRDADLEKQDLDYSCGSAATATILRSFYGSEVYEKSLFPLDFISLPQEHLEIRRLFLPLVAGQGGSQLALGSFRITKASGKPSTWFPLERLVE